MRFFWNKQTAQMDMEKPTEQATFAFCETVTAGANTPWHIRKLGRRGLMTGGGADTRALCGREVAWDLTVPLTEHHLNHSCLKCVDLYRRPL